MYLKWKENTITDFSDEHIESLYNQGYFFGRTGRGEMYQTRSLRIDLSKFALSSENRRILRKTESLNLTSHTLPYEQYHWSIGKLAKDFYDTKFGPGTMSANKVREMMTDPDKSNFNTVLVYTLSPYQGEPEGVNSKTNEGNTKDPSQPPLLGEECVAGYCIALETKNLTHYSYPFYDLDSELKNLGMGMMLKAILHAQEAHKTHIYLGSFQRPGDVYKLQFSGLEWFDGEQWKTDINELKQCI